MSLLSSRDRVLGFTTDQESELQLLMLEIETFAPEVLWMQGFQIYDWISEVKRAGWLRPEVWIPYIFAESVLEHSMNVKNAAEAVIKGTPEMIEVPENFPLMWKVHDMPEWHGILPDITPLCNYTKAQKDVLEKYAILYLEQVLWEKWKKETQLLREFVEQKTHDSKIMFYLDKIDTWVKWLDYEKLGYKKQISPFHQNALKYISESAYFTNIYNILLEREFKNMPAHFQYFMLLEMAGDYDKWRYAMSSIQN